MDRRHDGLGVFIEGVARGAVGFLGTQCGVLFNSGTDGCLDGERTWVEEITFRVGDREGVKWLGGFSTEDCHWIRCGAW